MPCRRLPRLGLLTTLLLAAGPVPTIAAQATRAERTDGRETSTYADVLAFLDSLAARTPDLRVASFGTSPEGRWLPWVLAARPMVAGPAEAARSGKPVIYLQANIHAGEVEGKEAALMLLRDLTVGPLRPLLDSVILLVVPIYNADGNERFAPGDRNRPGQNGPASVGIRANGQGLDLNRDYTKVEAPETAATYALLAAWDADVFVDLHTTNGSYHGYALTWSPGLNPNVSPANAWARDSLLPEVQARLRRRERVPTFPYGNFRNQDRDSLAQGWETYDARPRFGTNAMGLRGVIPVLSEAYSNDPFPTRIRSTYLFVRELLSVLAGERAAVRRVRAASARWRPDSIALGAVLAAPRMAEVIAELTDPDGDGNHGFARRRRSGTFRAVRMPVFDRFDGRRWVARPAGYLLPPGHADLAARLRGQGVLVARLREPWAGQAASFTPDSAPVAPFVFEGHRAVQLAGGWGPPAAAAVAAGWYWVPTDQPLGALAAYLLEPGSEDGFAAWNGYDRDLRRRAPLPLLRLDAPPAVATDYLP